MTKLLLGNSMWQLVVISDTMSKMILLLLLGMSIVCWTVFFYKLILVRVKTKQIKEALGEIKNKHTLAEFLTLAAQFSKTLPGYLINQTLAYIKHLTHRKESDMQYLSHDQWELAEQHIDQTYGEILAQEEAYMPILYSCAGVATLIGLFGTVWGLVHAFIRIGEKQAADIATVAPGIAEALITTLGGLMVAIPAYVMFHFLSVRVRALESHYHTFVDMFALRTKHLFVQSGRINIEKQKESQSEL